MIEPWFTTGVFHIFNEFIIHLKNISAVLTLISAMKRPLETLSLLFIVMLTSSFVVDNNEDELLRWSSTRKLAWSDYKGRPDPASDAAASTTTYLGIDYHFSNNGFTYKIDSRFSKTRSWGLHKTEYILSHEQGHFDIAEVYARKLHQKMGEYK